MPNELFYPVGVVTCIMVLTAHKPHYKQDLKNVSNIIVNKPTFFGYWKDDEFIKTKTQGRCDKYGKWNNTRQEWLNLYQTGSVISGKSAKKYVKEDNEWCCEAYMTVDYSNITEADFELELKKYLAFSVMNS